MSKKYRVVVVGAGMVGASAAYHLAKFGWRDILVVDKGNIPVNDGSTSHAPGGVVALSHSKVMTDFAVYTTDLYRSLAPYDNPRNTYNAVGSLEVALTEARWQDMIRLHGESLSYHTDSQLLTAEESQAKVPYLNAKRIRGSLFVPKSSLISGTNVSGAFLRDAQADGAVAVWDNTPVVDVEVENGRVTAVLTANPDHPRIECEQVLLCTNIWKLPVKDKLGIPLPLMAYEHQYLHAEPIAELADFVPGKREDEVIYPTVRELDSAMYYRQHWNRLGVGSYWHKPLAMHPTQVGKTAIQPFTPDDFFAEPWQRAKEVVPSLAQATQFSGQINGMFAFSIDGMPIIGESKVDGLWLAIASWITHAAGVAKSVAEWMVHGETEWDMRQCHAHRFLPFAVTGSYVTSVTKKNYREVYDIVHPKQSPSEPRNVRMSPFRARLEAMGVEYTAFAGLELPNWLEENGRLLEKHDDRIPHREGWGAQYWSRIMGAEHLETRENVALFDLTGLSIIEVKGSGAAAYVNYLCSNEMDKPIGSVVYTTWLTPSGGVKRDLAVARLDENQFWMFVGEGTLPQDVRWVEQHAPKDGSVVINDVSNSLTAVGLWGPNARKVLQKVTSDDVSNEAFPYFTCQWIDIAFTKVLALRLSYAGELGWELHFPMDQALAVWDALWAAGREFEMPVAGMGSFDSLRIEKGYRLWGGDVHTEYNPYEAGLGWTVRLKKGEFIGRDACLALKQKPLKKKLSCLTLTDPQATLMGYEPIMHGDNCVGYVTSANYGYTVGKYIAYGYLPTELATAGTDLEIIYFGNRYRATVAQEPLYDAEMAQLKS